MDAKTKLKLEKHKEEGTTFQGKVKLIRHDEVLDKDVLVLDIKNLSAIVPQDEVDVYNTNKALLDFIGAVINFKILDIREDGTLVCSRKMVKEEKRRELIAKFEAGEAVEGKITKILKYGAYLDIMGVQAVLKNVDFASDYTTIAEKHKVGDKIMVKLNKINSNNKIQVEAVEKFFTPTSIKFEDFIEGQLAYGKIRSIKPEACFVGLIPNLDALASIPDFVDFPIEEGMDVVLKITKIFPETQRIRGKIIKVYQHGTDLIED